MTTDVYPRENCMLKFVSQVTDFLFYIPMSVTSLSVTSYVGSATASRNTILACCV